MGKKLELFSEVMKEPEKTGFMKRRKLFFNARDEVFRIVPKQERRRKKSGRTKKK